MTMSDQEWADLKSTLPVGTTVSGRVAVHRSFGFFDELDELDELADVVALIEIPEYARQLGRPADLEDFPPIGAEVRGIVLDHVDGAQQIRLTSTERGRH